MFRGFRLLDMLSVSRPEISWSTPGETWWTWWSPPSRGSCWTSAEDWAYGTCCVSPDPSSLDFIYLQSYNDEVVTKFTLYPRVNHQPTTHKLPQNELSMRQLWSDLDIFCLSLEQLEVRTSARPCHGNPLPPSVADRQFCSVNSRLSSRWVFLHHPGP